MKVYGKNTLAMVLCGGLIASALSGCAHNKDKHLADDNAANQGGSGSDSGAGLDGDGINGNGLNIVYFDYNSAIVKPEAVAELQKYADRIRQGEQLQIQVEGHCDERGTQEYNLALGEERAIAVKNVLIRLGVEANQLDTISYGEERPAQSGQSEDAFAKNRRVEFNKSAS